MPIPPQRGIGIEKRSYFNAYPKCQSPSTFMLILALLSICYYIKVRVNFTPNKIHKRLMGCSARITGGNGVDYPPPLPPTLPIVIPGTITAVLVLSPLPLKGG